MKVTIKPTRVMDEQVSERGTIKNPDCTKPWEHWEAPPRSRSTQVETSVLGGRMNDCKFQRGLHGVTLGPCAGQDVSQRGAQLPRKGWQSKLTSSL